MTKRLQMEHYNLVGLPAHSLPSSQKLQQLVVLLEHAKKPVLIHCREGADRSGLAAAITLILAGDQQARDLKRQLSWQYNVLSRHSIGYQVFQNYFAWLHKNGDHISRASFIQWVNSNPILRPYSGRYLL